MSNDPNTIIEFIKGFNIQNIISLGTMMWLFAKYIRYQIKSFEKRIDFQDERIFQLATGKTLKEAMLEAKKKSEVQ